mmetsp:Transcript_7032/g.13258  ORF Transcript_7032/g.13258 Transcript_7032/m.13258 type:complete len:1459 (+) Transcript_7032:892-5268(+)
MSAAAAAAAVPAPLVTTATTAAGPVPASSTNPFDDDDNNNDHDGLIPSSLPFSLRNSAAVSTNPFDSNDTQQGAASAASAGGGDKRLLFVPSLNPSSNDTRPKHNHVAAAASSSSHDVMTTFDSLSNPFSNNTSNNGASSVFEDVFAPPLASALRSSTQTQQHVRRQTTNEVLMNHSDRQQGMKQQGKQVSSVAGGGTGVNHHQTSVSLFEFPDLDNQGTTVKKPLFARRKTTSFVSSTGTEPLANAVDQEEKTMNHNTTTSSSSNTATTSTSAASRLLSALSSSNHGDKSTTTKAAESSPMKPTKLGSHSRSKSDGMALRGTNGNTGDHQDKEGTLGGWLMRGGGGSGGGGDNTVGTPKRNKNKTTKQSIMNKLTPGGRKNTNKAGGVGGGGGGKDKRMKNVFVQCWPYDDYHKEQEKYYQSIQERDYESGSPTARKRRGGSKSKSGVDLFGYNSGSEEEDEMNMMNRNNNSNNNDDMRDEGMMLERPVDLPSIKEEVQNLSLFDFETKAKDRAISIVSTWLFDSGLIDELLVGGGMNVTAATAGVGVGSNYSVMSGNSYNTLAAASVRTSEGVEVGAHGFPLEGSFKVDKEVEKLRMTTQRELTLINTRLNDGVAASGSEVQELVNAVSTTKSELGRLRELATYISSGYKDDSTLANNRGDAKNALILSEYPRLKRAINARRNVFRCFRELEFFSQIPLTCDRLREELHQGEWTANEWNTIRDVCMEHVELEILLVEAEAGMKAWIDDEDDGDDDSSMPSLRSNKSLKKSWKGRQQAALLAGNHQVVDEFLSQHVKNVWELGDEIRMRILSGVGSAYDLALQNPAGMVALVEAVEVYERAADQFKASRGGEYESNKNHLRFTDMRAAALAQLYQDFELRGLEVFRAIHMQAADMADESDALNSQFNAVLRAATELVTEIDVVKNQMAPCFAPHWHVEMLWSSCVAHVCSNQIIQQIGGPEGQNLPDLSVTQLLDLVAWVEFFRETIEDAFPSIGSVSSKKTYFDERPDLFAGNHKVVNMENAKDSLAWVNNMLWEVHRLAQDEFLLRTRSQSDEWITKVYSAKHETTQTREGRLVTSLCEDVFSLASVQLRTIRERLTKKSDALVMAVCLIFSQLRSKQLSSRNTFLTDLESCCAAANDFQRMSEQVEDMVHDLIDHSELPQSSVQMLEDSCGALVSLYSGDAVYAAQRAHGFIFEPIEEAISQDLFGPKWETELTSNELAMTLTRTLDDFMGDLETFLDEFMLKKTVDAIVASSVVFYVKCLLLKAEKHNNNKQPYFGDSALAVERMDRDIKVMKDYFDGLAEAMPALNKVIEKEFAVLTTVQELIRIAAGISDSDASDFILVLHKQVKDINITKHVVGDLWHLVQPTEERTIWEQTESLEESLLAVCPPDNNKIANNRMTVPGLRLDETLAKLCIESKRKRPVHATVVENMLGSLKKNWATTNSEAELTKKSSM